MKFLRRSNARGRAPAFSLTELLVVMGIIAVLTAFAVPAFNSIGKARALSSSADRFNDAIRLARQEAMARGRGVELRIYKIPPSGETAESFSAYARSDVADSGADGALKAGLEYLAPGVVFSEQAQYSTLLDGDLETDSENRKYRAFRFRSDGSTDLDPGSKWFVTMVQTAGLEAGVLPPNFVCLQIDPTSGVTTFYRP